MPAVMAGLFGLFWFRAGCRIRSTGEAAGSSCASMMPPVWPMAIKAARSVGVSAANGSRVGNMRPKRPRSK